MALRFSVLWHHQVDQPHFDLLLETRPGSDLATWRSPVWPITEPTTLTRLKDHRRIYLQYTGEISESRGRVDRVGDGTCRIEVSFEGAWMVHFFETNLTLHLAPINREEWVATPV
jgi:hypothetical protein